MKAPRLGTIAALCVLACRPAWSMSLADLHSGAWDGTFTANYQLQRDDASSADGGSDVSSRYRSTREGLTIRNEGFYFIDPRLVTGSLGLTFELVQEHVLPDEMGGTRRDRLVGYAFDADVLQNLPYNGQLFANRNQDVVNQPFSRTTTSFENRGLSLHLREDSPLRSHGFPYFSANARLEQEHVDTTTTSATTQMFRNDERQNRLKLDAHNGLLTGDVDATYLFTAVKNATLPEASFDSQNATFRYSQDFGPTLNWRSDSNFSYYSRTGASRSRVLLADEALHIDHNSNLSSTYGYAVSRTESVTGTTGSQDESALVSYQPYRNLMTHAQLKAQQQHLPEGSRDNVAGQGDATYQHALPWGGRLSATVGGRRRLDDNRLQMAQINVLDEAQTAPAMLGAGAGSLLAQPFAVPGSIVVVDTRGGSRLPTTQGIDYELVTEGNLTRIVPLPTSTVIRPGDPLLVSYAYELNPNIRYSTLANWVNASVDFDWIGLSLGHQQSNQKLLAGQDNGFLQDMREDKGEVDLRHDWAKVQATASAAFTRFDSTRLAYRQRDYTQHTAYRPRDALTLGLDLNRTLIDYTLPVRQTDMDSARASLDYFRGRWTVTGQLARRIYKDSLLAEEQIDEARLSARWIFGKLSVSTGLTAGRRSRGGFRTSNYGLNITAVRQF